MLCLSLPSDIRREMEYGVENPTFQICTVCFSSVPYRWLPGAFVKAFLAVTSADDRWFSLAVFLSPRRVFSRLYSWKIWRSAKKCSYSRSKVLLRQIWIWISVSQIYISMTFKSDVMFFTRDHSYTTGLFEGGGGNQVLNYLNKNREKSENQGKVKQKKFWEIWQKILDFFKKLSQLI